MLHLLDGKKINLNGTLLGYKQLSQFSLNVISEDGIYGYLQSLEEESLGFIVASPFTFYKEYSFELSETEQQALNIESAEDVMVLGIIRLKEPFPASTMNLLAPILVNISNGKGQQIVLPTKYEYETKTPLFQSRQQAPEHEDGGDEQC